MKKTDVNFVVNLIYNWFDARCINVNVVDCKQLIYSDVNLENEKLLSQKKKIYI